MHLRRFGVPCAGLYKGSKSKLLFKVAPQAIFVYNDVDGFGGDFSKERTDIKQNIAKQDNLIFVAVKYANGLRGELLKRRMMTDFEDHTKPENDLQI